MSTEVTEPAPEPYYRIYLAGLAYLDPLPWRVALEIADNLVKSGQEVELRPAQDYHRV